MNPDGSCGLRPAADGSIESGRTIRIRKAYLRSGINYAELEVYGQFQDKVIEGDVNIHSLSAEINGTVQYGFRQTKNLLPLLVYIEGEFFLGRWSER